MNEVDQPRRRSLSEVLAAPECVIASSVFDPVSARFARALGSEVSVMGGSVASWTVLGAPDMVLLTASELCEQARRVCRTDCVNLVVDADHGYGNALNVARVIEDLQAAGVAAACVEDSVLPRPFGADESQGLVSLDEGIKKMRAAVRARGTGPMLVVARTNANASAGAQEAAKRLQAYQDTGVDALFLPYLKRREDLDLIVRNLRLPILVAGSDAALFDLDYLASRNVKVWLWGHQPFGVAAQALFDAMQATQAGKTPTQLAGPPSKQLMPMATDQATYQSWIETYLK